MTDVNVELKSVPSVRLHEGTALAPGAGPQNVSPVIGPLYTRVIAAITGAGVPLREPPIAYYTPNSSGGGFGEVSSGDAGLVVHAGFIAEEGDPEIPGVATIELPAEPLVASLIHRGEMPRIGDSWEALTDWVDANGYRPVGPCREVYLTAEPHPQSEWVTELQWPVERVG
jgi:hypothetical protein